MPAHIVAAIDSWTFLRETGLIYNGKTVSKASVCAHVASLARGISSVASVGEVVAYSGTNTDATFEVLLAIAAAGCIACPLNTRWSDRDVQHAIQLTSPVLLFVEPGLEAVAKSCLAVNPEIRIVPIMTHGGQQYASFKDVPQRALLSTTSQLIAKHRGAPLRLQRPDCGTALICFTSGTTAAAKGVRISHSALVVQSLIKLAMVAYSRDDVYLHVAPLFHIGGISSALSVLMAGGCHVFLQAYSAPAVLALIHQHNVSAMIAVPTMLQDICSLSHADPCPTMRRLLVGAGSVSDAAITRIAEIMPNACIQTAYGMTEAASSITFLTLVPSPRPHRHAGGTNSAGAPGDTHEPPSVNRTGDRAWGAAPEGAGPSRCVGHPAPGIQLRLRRIDDAQEHTETTSSGSPQEGSVEPRCVGEVLVRGAQVTCGYWRDAAATAAALRDPPGWLRTGDIGWLDSGGRLHLCGRLKDMIKSGGENVHASEVERALSEVPGVTEAAVVAAPHPRFGETVAALLCGRPSDFQPAVRGGGGGAAATGAANGVDPVPVPLEGEELHALQAALRTGGLAGFKIPRVAVVAVRPLPRTAMGKVDKRAVRAVLDAAQRGQRRSRL